MMVDGAVVLDVFYWERIGFRNAWITITQLPLLYLLSSKVNVIGFIAGISHERLNWIHRWVGRTMLITATMHGFHFYTQYVQGDVWETMVKVMPMVKYGLGAWAILLWTTVTSFGPFRRMAYEVFIVQHIISAVLLLWLLYAHIPSYAMYNLWFAIGALCFDRAARLVILVWQNLRVWPNRSPCQGMKRIGHQAQLQAVGGNITIVTIKDAHFAWRAGQHLYLWLPGVAPLEAHPYTIACAHQLPGTCICNSIQLVIRAHNGFSKRLLTFAEKNHTNGRNERLTAFVSGPYGKPARWDIYETLVLISASTGASFTLPILESILHAKGRTCTKRVEFVLSARQGEEVEFYVQRLREALDRANTVGLELTVHIAVTGSKALSSTVEKVESSRESSSIDSPKNQNQTTSAFAVCCCDNDGQEKKAKATAAPDVERETSSSASISAERKAGVLAEGLIREYSCRPDIELHIREPVEAASGETSVVVCGGPSLVARVRNCVAKLSDERAAHKGTGAQGIHLHVEEYSF
jgi:predicted ferric reductase